MKLGLVTYLVAKDWDVDTIVKNCAAAGFSGVELRATHAHGVEETLNKAQRAEVRKKFADSPVACYGLGSALDYHTPDQSKLRADIEASKRYLQLAADVGCEGIKVRPNALPPEVPEAKTLEQIGKSVAEVAAAGKDLGLKVWLEVHGKETCRPDRMRKIMDHADHSNAYVTWNCNPTEPDANGSVKAHFELLKHRIGCVHMQELWDTKRYPWQEIFTLLKGSGYAGWTSWEGSGPTTPADAVWGMKCYRRIWELYVQHA
ncbi:MAG: sugar phosphate isomerase/epimerase [Planctomycetota bacterium]|nr:sugar phosphate isomerase/epimerase [Planctomycetota bacterium]